MSEMSHDAHQPARLTHEVVCRNCERSFLRLLEAEAKLDISHRSWTCCDNPDWYARRIATKDE